MPHAGSRPRRRAVGTVALTAAALLPLASLGSTASAAPAGLPARTPEPVAAVAGTAGVGPAAGADRVKPLPDDVRFYQSRVSLLGRHVWYRQVRAGHVVVGGWYARHFDADGNLVAVWDGRRALSKAPSGDVLVSGQTAITRATASAGGDHAGDSAALAPGDVLDAPELMLLPGESAGDPARLVWSVTAVSRGGAVTSYVDAATGAVLEREHLSKHVDDPQPRLVTARGRVFDPNPVVALQRASLRDRGDRTTPALRRAYAMVDLPRLRPDRGLAGRWVRIVNSKRAVSAKDQYVYSRTDNRFEQVVAYHAIDSAQAYLHRLGFRDVNAEPQSVVTNRYTEDNSFYEPGDDVIHFGSGGVDDAEDVEIVWHEYGHAIQDDQVPAFGSSPQAGAIGEGFGDYLAVTMSEPTSSDTSVTPLACVGDWDAVSYDLTAPHCLRRVDGRLTYDDRSYDVHHDGRIWSRALWDIRQGIAASGSPAEARDLANRIIIEAQFWMNPRVTMPQAARITVAVARQLGGAEAADVARAAFVDRGILSAPA